MSATSPTPKPSAHSALLKGRNRATAEIRFSSAVEPAAAILAASRDPAELAVIAAGACAACAEQFSDAKLTRFRGQYLNRLIFQWQELDEDQK